MVGEVVITPRQKLEDLIRLAELCVDLLRQNEEFYAEVISILAKKTLKTNAFFGVSAKNNMA